MAFLESQMSKDKVTTLLAIKPTILIWWPVIFFTQSSFSIQYLFSTSVTTSH